MIIAFCLNTQFIITSKNLTEELRKKVTGSILAKQVNKIFIEMECGQKQYNKITYFFCRYSIRGCVVRSALSQK